MKITLVLTLFLIGSLIIFKLRGFYLNQRLRGEENNLSLKKLRLIIGFTYIIIAFGILFNYFTYVLIWIFKNFDGILIISLNLLMNMLPENYQIGLLLFIDLFHPVLAILSFIALLQYILSLFYIVRNNNAINSPKKAINLLFLSIIEIIFFGLGCLPYLL